MAEIIAPNRPQERTFSSLQNTAFRNIWAAATLSHFGAFVHLTAVAWLMTSLTTSNTLIALVQTAAAVPVMLLALLAGATADIYDKRKQMMLAILLSATSVFAMVVLYEMNLLEPWSVLLLTATLGLGGAFYGPAWQSSLPEIVPRTDLISAISLNNLSMNVARCLGPAIAAELLVRAGVSVAFLINGFSFIFLILAIRVWKRKQPDTRLPRENLFRAIGDGLRYVSISPEMRSTLLRAFTFAFSSSAILALPPSVALMLGGGARTLGILLFGFGAGAMTGALSLTRIRSLVPVNTLALISSAIMALALLGFGLSDTLWLTTSALVLGGFCWVQIVSTLQISIQTSCPRWVVGRMVSLLAMAFSAGIAGGSAIWGGFSDIFGIKEALVLSALTMFLTGLLLRLFPFHQPPEEDLEPQPTDVLDSLPDLNPKAGPVIICVEYRVPRKNAEAFMQAMYAIRRIRLRDGGRRWTLSQDIVDNSIWIEQFQSPTWEDYRVRVSRRLTGDIAAHDIVKDLCNISPLWTRRLERPALAEPLDICWPNSS